jgi:hypothetical protein
MLAPCPLRAGPTGVGLALVAYPTRPGERLARRCADPAVCRAAEIFHDRVSNSGPKSGLLQWEQPSWRGGTVVSVIGCGRRLGGRRGGGSGGVGRTAVLVGRCLMGGLARGR